MSKAKKLVQIFTEMYGDEPRTISKDEIKTVAKENDIPSLYRIMNANNIADNGEYHFPPVGNSASVPTAKVRAPKTVAKVVETPKTVVSLSMETSGFTENLVPEKDDLFVPFGNFKTVNDILKSKMFYPIFITGLSGNGKTYMVEQSCAKLKREVIRVNFTVETDEDDLIGGFRLVNGETKFFKGPLIKAMERGAVLLADEIDLANPAKVMCMQSILEGKGYFIKKTGEYITPAAGFNVIATANTKGKGSDDGRFIGTNILNEAFLERYPITCEQEYPSVSIEKKILDKVAASVEVDDETFIQKLVDWADIIRKTFNDGGVDEIISTRRLVHIIKAHSIFNDRMTAITMCTNRFDDETKVAFLDLYTKLDDTIVIEEDTDEGL
jgi:MoxR-like ATPase